MKTYLLIPFILLTMSTAVARESSSKQSAGANQYRECVAVSLHTMNGQELDSIVRNNRVVEDANLIPEGWVVVGVTTKSEGPISRPYMVICH